MNIRKILLVIATVLSSTVLFSSEKFPKLEAFRLAGGNLEFPEVLQEHEVALVIMAFDPKVQYQVESWVKPFLNEFGESELVNYYEIPMIKEKYKRHADLIEKFMKAQVPDYRFDNVGAFYGDWDTYINYFNFPDTKRAYVFLVDKKGQILWRTEGKSDEQRITELLNKTRELTEQTYAENL